MGKHQFFSTGKKAERYNALRGHPLEPVKTSKFNIKNSDYKITRPSQNIPEKNRKSSFKKNNIIEICPICKENKNSCMHLSDQIKECPVCQSMVEISDEAIQAYCPKGHLVFSKPKDYRIVRNTYKLDEGKEFYGIEVKYMSTKRHEVGILKYKGYSIFINNVRLGEKVNLEIEKVIPEKSVAFAKVIKYIKTVGELDYYRQFNCPQEVSGLASGGRNRMKCISVFLPEERVRDK